RFFNPSYLNKWEVYQAFKKDKFLSDYLPETRPFQNLDSFHSFLSEKKRLYAKHRSLSQGNGIDLLIFEENGAVTCQNVHQKRQYPSIESCYADRKEEWTGQYILQEAVETEKING
ncbi:YheC/YheD family protein, partial [Bacillus smithii]|uniref:YheC/YheD family protein n=1 Tax=Bacillus smithii TaxID=1479 RepID=UPI00399D0C63